MRVTKDDAGPLESDATASVLAVSSSTRLCMASRADVRATRTPTSASAGSCVSPPPSRNRTQCASVAASQTACAVGYARTKRVSQPSSNAARENRDTRRFVRESATALCPSRLCVPETTPRVSPRGDGAVVNRPNAPSNPRRVASDSSKSAEASSDAFSESASPRASRRAAEVPSRWFLPPAPRLASPPNSSAPRMAPATASASVACSRPRARARRAYSLSSFARA
mmetsp:Transcript_271/g.1130  ORF Transcript_271/g.1130 Transcript_271/m.1130 type:complete len:226 (+) Transcript_271:176-853(+)